MSLVDRYLSFPSSFKTGGIELGYQSFARVSSVLAVHKCNGLKKGILIIAAALCAVEAHAEDAREAVRTSQSIGNAVSFGTFETICRTMERSAADNNLPIEFFTRLIWQESRFNVRARSSAGAQGIAQFMPQTASSRGLLILLIRFSHCLNWPVI